MGGRAACCLASCGGPPEGKWTDRGLGSRRLARPPSCELHLNGRLSRARRAGVWAAGAGRATGGERRKRLSALAFCNLLGLLPRLAPGSAAKGVGEGGARAGALRQWNSRDGAVDRGSLNSPPDWDIRSDGRNLQQAFRKLQEARGPDGGDGRELRDGENGEERSSAPRTTWNPQAWDTFSRPAKGGSASLSHTEG